MLETSTRQSEQTHPREREAELSAALQEVVAEFGLRAVVAELMKDGAAEHLKLGGNETLRVIQVVIRSIVYADDPQLEAEVMALGAGVILADGVTQTKLAAKHGLTRAAMSKRVVQFCEAHGLPASAYMKPNAARASYEMSARGNDRMPGAPKSL